MALSLYEGKRRQPSRFLVFLMVADAAFATSSASWCTFISVFVTDPIRWATWYGVGTRPELFEYPFVVLWLLPVGGICGAWLAEKGHNGRLACFFALFPLLFLGLLVGWYYLLPVEWR
jgi:hypothetical protein